MLRRPRHPVQLSLPGTQPLPGRRRGRPPRPDRERLVSHLARPTLSDRHPVHITLRVRDDVPNLRRDRFLPRLVHVLRAGSDRFGFRLCHYVVMGNHLHLIAEASDARALARGVQGLSIRLARGLNRVAARRGRFFLHRYHARALRTPTEVHRTLVYVLLNQRRHAAERGFVGASTGPDAFSSSAWFPGWHSPRAAFVHAAVRQRAAAADPPVVTPGTWLLRDGWRRAGPVSPDAIPTGAR